MLTFRKTNINYEQGVDAEVFANYGLQLSASPKDASGDNPIFDDLTVIFRMLLAVTNNSPNNVGGGGKPIADAPLELCAPPVAR